MFTPFRKFSLCVISGVALSQGINYYAPTYQPYSVMNLVFAKKMTEVPAKLNLTYKHQLFPVVGVEEVSHDVKIISFGLGEDQEFQMRAAQTLQCSVWDYSRGTRITRNYTPISSNGTKGKFDIMVKKYNNGYMSPRLTDLEVGDAFAWALLPSSFLYQKNKHETMYMMAGGVGITPMLQLIRTVLADPTDKTKMKLLFLNRTESDILLREELDGFMAKHPNQFQVVYSVETPSENWVGEVGRATPDMIRRTLTGAPKEKEHMLVCGPDGFMTAMAGCAPAVMGYWSGKQKSQPTFIGANNLGIVQGVLGDMGWTGENCWRF